MAKKTSSPGTEPQSQLQPQLQEGARQASLLDKVTAEVTPEVSPFLRFITDNVAGIAIAFALFLAAGIGYGAYQWFAANSLRQARADLGAIEVIRDAAERTAALEKFIAGAPGAIAPAANLALAKAALESEDFEKAAMAWERVAGNESGAFLIVAVTGQAEALVQAGKDAEALALLQKHRETGSDVSRAMIDSLIVGVAEKNKNYAAAIAASESLASNPASAGEAEFWRQKAAALRAAGQAS